MISPKREEGTMSGCQNFSAFLTAERDSLRVAIAANRCLLSRQIGKEVGSEEAKQDFVDHLLSAFALQFRRSYCQTCPSAARCVVRYNDERSQGH
jgi:hypothetical protein